MHSLYVNTPMAGCRSAERLEMARQAGSGAIAQAGVQLAAESQHDARL
jgi:hypothetical protein